jgi:hypothetical protein
MLANPAKKTFDPGRRLTIYLNTPQQPQKSHQFLGPGQPSVAPKRRPVVGIKIIGFINSFCHEFIKRIGKTGYCPLYIAAAEDCMCKFNSCEARRATQWNNCISFNHSSSSD